MKTAEQYWNGYKTYDKFCDKYCIYDLAFEGVITARDKEWTQKIQTALDKTSNWNCKEVLTKLLEDK